ncbi:MAG: molybdenum cofactor guanylyltransferase [Desulforhopalus sp.]
MKKHKNRFSTMTDTPVPLPVFQLSGGSGEQREHFLKLLVSGLKYRALTCKIVGRGESLSLYSLHHLVKGYDLVVADANVDMPMPAVKICCDGGTEESDLNWSTEKSTIEQFLDQLVSRLDTLVKTIPVWGCVLIGGKSSRMGRPKHLLTSLNGTSWVENTLKILTPLLDGLVVSGGGVLPESLRSRTRLADVPGVVGPLSGVLAACRWQPLASWLLIACDMPNLSEEAVRWLLDKRHAGCWGVAPRQAGKEYCEPLFSWYDMRATQLFEEQVLQGNMRIGAVASHPNIENPVIPDRLRNAWQNVNTPEQLKALEL